jgi:cell wall-associated NlpC family hydrolase
MMAKIGLVAMAACGSFAILVLASLTGFPNASIPSAMAQGQIPATYLGLYQRAALTCPGLDWTVLAAIGKVESDHGRSTLPGVHSGANPAGAQGPMQMVPATFAAYEHPVDADPLPTEAGGAKPPSPYNPTDATYAAARYLCASHVADDVSAAVITYNCGNPGQACQVAAAGYAADVLSTAASYRTPDDQPGTAADTAVQAAMAMLGTAYVWGGEDPSGFDCSGLVQWAYAHAGITLPRTAQLQYDAGPRRRAGAQLQPGDLLFFGGGPKAIHHVGIFIGDGLIVDAPHTGAVVRLDRVEAFAPPYVGATAPGNGK